MKKMTSFPYVTVFNAMLVLMELNELIYVGIVQQLHVIQLNHFPVELFIPIQKLDRVTNLDTQNMRGLEGRSERRKENEEEG